MKESMLLLGLIGSVGAQGSGQGVRDPLFPTAASVYTLFNPATACEKTPRLIRDAAKDAGTDVRVLCYISDRAKFASDAGEATARRLDRIGNMVQVVIPFGHLLVVNGTELGVQMAVSFYDSENEKRMQAGRLPGDRYRGGQPEAAYNAVKAIRQIRRFYAAELALHKAGGRQ